MADALEIKFEGIEAIERKLGELAATAPQAAQAALYQEAQALLTASKRLVPVDTGTLRASGMAGAPVLAGNTLTARVGYGGPAASYAAKVHESPRAGRTGGWGPISSRMIEAGAKGRRRARYKHWARTGQWKYLEQPWLEIAGKLPERIGARMRKWLETHRA